MLALLSLSLVSCARQQSGNGSTLAVFDTQVKNAVNMGDGDLEIQALRKRLLDNPRDLTVRRRLAAKFEAAGYGDLALEHLRIAAELAPTDLALHLELVAALKAQGLGHQATMVLNAALAAGTPTPAQLSKAAIFTESLAEAEALHRKAVAAEPRNWDFLNNLAYNLIQQKRAAEAETLLRDLLRARPTHEHARNNLAMLYATQLHQPEEALLHWKAISGPAAAHNNLAVAYMEQEKWIEAKAELEKALALRFQFPEAIQNLQIVAARTGGTVTLNLNRDKSPSGLSKLAKAIRHVFIGEETDSEKSKSRRSRS